MSDVRVRLLVRKILAITDPGNEPDDSVVDNVTAQIIKALPDRPISPAPLAADAPCEHQWDYSAGNGKWDRHCLRCDVIEDCAEPARDALDERCPKWITDLSQQAATENWRNGRLYNAIAAAALAQRDDDARANEANFETLERTPLVVPSTEKFSMTDEATKTAMSDAREFDWLEAARHVIRDLIAAADDMIRCLPAGDYQALGAFKAEIRAAERFLRALSAAPAPAEAPPQPGDAAFVFREVLRLRDEQAAAAQPAPLPADAPQERIACAAIAHDATGLVFSLPRPARHHDILHAMHLCGLTTKHSDTEQGFLTNAGRFVWRESAKDIARSAGQLTPRAVEARKELYSEDVW